MPDDKKGDKGKGSEDLDLSKNPAIIEMGKTIKGLGILLTQQGAAQAKQTESLSELVETIKAGKLSGTPEPDPKNVDPDAINELDNSQLVPLVLSEVGKLLDDKLGGINKKVDATDQSILDKDLKSQFTDILKSNPDFLEWSGEIKDLNTKSPGLTMKQVYTLARTENPTKSAEMDEKYKSDEDKSEKKPGLIGLMPTSGVMVEGDEKLTTKEAGEQAWEDTLESFPELAQLGEG